MEKTLGQVLLDARVQRELTQREVALKTGVSAMFISELENGKKIPQKGEALKKICTLYKLDYEEILGLALVSKYEEGAKSMNDEFSQRLALARTILSKPLSIEKFDEILKILKEEK